MSDTSDDVCGDILESIRNAVGEKVIISVSFDLHANVTEKTLKNVDYVSGYQTYPHLDLYEVGVRSAERIIEHFEKGRAYVSRAEAPIIAPAHAYTTSTRELKKLMDKANGIKESGKIVDYAIFQAQPWLDAKELFATVIVTAYDKNVALEVANELIIDEFNLRKDLQGAPLLSIEEVIQKALENKSGKPVVLCDSADSPNAGANGDSATVLEKLLPYKDDLKCAVAVVDKNAVDKAFELGVGGEGDFVLGATIAPELSKPVLVKGATVKLLSDGEFFMYGPQERGQRRDNGKTALIKVGNINIHISYGARTIGDRGFYRSVGIEPEFMDLVCVKACTSFRAGYSQITDLIYNAQTTGAAGTDLNALPFKKRPKPLYPFEEITLDNVGKAKIYR
jgi:microcystin degradation protein MlrC